jgi:hypothetical protein
MRCYVRRDRQIEGWILWIEIQNFGTPLQMRYTSTETLRNLWPCYRQCSRYHITVYKVNTATYAVHWLTQMIWVQKVHISNTTLNSITLNFIAALSGYTSYYVITTVFLTFPIFYKLKNAQWSDEYSVYKINPDIHFMCELHVTVKLYRAACSLYDADSNFSSNL